MNGQKLLLGLPATLLALAACQHRGQADESVVASLGTPGGQILGTLKAADGSISKVCIYKFEDNKYEISTPASDGKNCQADKHKVDKAMVDYGSDAFGSWLSEVKPGGMIKLDMVYATDKIFPKGNEKNPMGNGSFRITSPLYGKARCFLHPLAIKGLQSADRILREDEILGQKHPNMRLLMKDCYRPEYVSGIMWEKVKHSTDIPDPGTYVAANGRSGHNKGGTVDLTLAIQDGDKTREVDMGSVFDLFSPISHFESPFRITDEQERNRRLLQDVMVKAGFSPYLDEWWHFSMKSVPNDSLDLPI